MLWGISWLNIQTMLADSLRPAEIKTDENGNPIQEEKIIHRELKTKDDIKNYIKGII